MVAAKQTKPATMHTKYQRTRKRHSEVVDLRTAVPNPVASYPAWRKSAWYTLMRFQLIKNGVAHVYDVYTV